jgi:hypothetical protein
MKKPNVILTIIIFCTYLSPVFTLVYFRERPFCVSLSNASDPFLPLVFIAYIGHLIKYLRNTKNVENPDSDQLAYKLRIIWASYYLSIAILLIYYIFNFEPIMGYNYFLVVFGFFLMIDGNYQVVLPKESTITDVTAKTYAVTYGDKNYRKYQRTTGRFQFYLGLLIVITLLILPNTSSMWLYCSGVMFVVYYIGDLWIMFRNKKIVSEAKSK